MRRRAEASILALYFVFLLFIAPQGCWGEQGKNIVIDAAAASHPFPHFWEKTFGSGRAILSLREAYRKDLREMKAATDIQYVRFHAIFHDELGVYDEDKAANPVYNFSYVDQVYDGLLENGVRPFVEISFMPKKLAAREAIHPFWYKQNVSPPKSYDRWDEFIRNFARHLLERYGEDEVAQWYFEVWNEPNIDFWAGDPKQKTYFELYDHTARALKSVSPRLRVGGPATAAADWVDVFIAHCVQEKVPLDFISSHGYADDTVENLFHNHEDVPMDQRVCRAIRKVHDQIAASARPSLPLMWTEWNVPSFGPLQARDTIYVGSALADDIRQCDGLVDMMSYWTFDDVFEESGPVKEPFYGGFGTIAAGGIRKPSFNGFALLHKLGNRRLENAATNAIVTQRENGDLVVALWNLVDPDQKGAVQSLNLEFRGVAGNSRVFVSRLDEQHGNTLAAYARMGKPRYPTRAQIQQLNREGKLPSADETILNNGHLSLEVHPNGLLILEIPK